MTESLYRDHLATLQARYEKAMQHYQIDAIVLASGDKSYYFQDDHTVPFHAYSGAQQWLPFSLVAETYIVVQAGKKPRLVWPVRDDFWHAPNPVPAGEWQTEWEISPARKDDKWFSSLPTKCAWLGPQPPAFATKVEGLNAYVDFAKAIKTPFEINAIRLATKRAVKGHRAAKEAFLAGMSELEIHLAFLSASQQTAAQEPYPGIVGINNHAAVLHYEHKDPNRSARPLTLLIDAGASEHGYASDITRTFVRHDDEFSALVDSLDKMEQGLAHQARSGVDYRTLHQDTLTGVAHILNEHKICHLSPEEQMAKGIPQVFFPHGLGHLLGLQVHDVGGFQVDEAGTVRKDDNAPFLRLTRTLEENMVVTIEPGLYFIPMLLEKMQASIPQHGCDLSLIERFKPYGGIRIEDNVVVQDERPINLTRNEFQLDNPLS
ncbi:Xaa-Pro dipeptidase [Marinomonas pollencensis]|uniref:Xaa-Pro dipeptidase n=1 Tax=Marinomonas pollencensis TaxID=491954 RepID=A0A3E0DSX2_9GAMM|nr:Xaa-Pro dipeptidase [Marinomonas pollencensis]REG85061.1 Xaa-Pro dipeptidase [Marinomonas pollencensis]